MKVALIQMASYDDEEVLMLDFDRDHLMYARRFHLYVSRPPAGGLWHYQHADR